MSWVRPSPGSGSRSKTRSPRGTKGRNWAAHARASPGLGAPAPLPARGWRCSLHTKARAARSHQRQVRSRVAAIPASTLTDWASLSRPPFPPLQCGTSSALGWGYCRSQPESLSPEPGTRPAPGRWHGALALSLPSVSSFLLFSSFPLQISAFCMRTVDSPSLPQTQKVMQTVNLQNNTTGLLYR